jgi:hypothetical protein
MNRRRRALLGAFGGAGVLVAGGGFWLAGPAAPLRRLPELAQARRWIEALAVDPAARSLAGWPLAQVLEHATQSIDCSIDGYPQLEPAWFRRSVGALAFASFDRAGAMRHDLDAAIPGTAALQAGSVTDAAAALLAALSRFEQHRGALAPHFAYGVLDHRQYLRAHLMHLADHARRIVPTPE